MTDDEYKQAFFRAVRSTDGSPRAVARSLVKMGRNDAVFAASRRADLTAEQLEKLAQWLKEEE